MSEETRDTRRDALKKVGKVAAFVIPTMVTFDISALAVPKASGGHTTPDESW